jgi:hypothetical protein
MPSLIKLTISITATGAVDIDCAGKKGGHVRGMALRRVRWLKDAASVDRFDLKFERLEDVDGSLSEDPDWPFIDPRLAPNGATYDDEAGTVTGAEKFTARLADGGVYKYTVTAWKGANKYLLDPVIIVGR